MNKSYLIVCDRAPYSSQAVAESLDMAMSGAAFDMPVQVLLRGDGVYAALAGQSPLELEQKNAGKRLSALEIYGIEDIYADGEALLARSLTAADLVPSVSAANSQQIASLLEKAQIIVQL